MLGSGVRAWRCSAGHPPSTAMSTGPAARLPRTFLERCVLIIEDEAMIAWTVESLLEDMGFSSITIAARGEDAIAAAEEVNPGLIISDINLGGGGMDGITAAATISRCRTIATVFITGYAGGEPLTRINSQMPHALVLRKPVAFDDLLRALIRLADGLKLD